MIEEHLIARVVMFATPQRALEAVGLEGWACRKAYLEQKRAEGKTKREALRCLKRHLARRIHRLLSMQIVDPDPITFNPAISGGCLT